MIIVKVELHSAITGKVSLLASMVIANIGGTHKRGNYKVAVANKRDAGDHRATLTRPQRSGSVSDYPRLSYSVWRLVSRAVLSAFPEERQR